MNSRTINTMIYIPLWCTIALKRYLLRGYRICYVVGDSKYGKYDFAPSALHLQHSLSRYVSRKNCRVKNDFPLWKFILEEGDKQLPQK